MRAPVLLKHPLRRACTLNIEQLNTAEDEPDHARVRGDEREVAAIAVGPTFSSYKKYYNSQKKPN
jgi:hypothetical protein